MAVEAESLEFKETNDSQRPDAVRLVAELPAAEVGNIHDIRTNLFIACCRSCPDLNDCKGVNGARFDSYLLELASVITVYVHRANSVPSQACAVQNRGLRLTPAEVSQIREVIATPPPNRRWEAEFASIKSFYEFSEEEIAALRILVEKFEDPFTEAAYELFRLVLPMTHNISFLENFWRLVSSSINTNHNIGDRSHWGRNPIKRAVNLLRYGLDTNDPADYIKLQVENLKFEAARERGTRQEKYEVTTQIKVVELFRGQNIHNTICRRIIDSLGIINIGRIQEVYNLIKGGYLLNDFIRGSSEYGEIYSAFEKAVIEMVSEQE